jgi:hypothetical protein
MILEHWYDEQDGSTTVFLKENRDNHLRLLHEGSWKCCEIEGEDWEDCMRKYHEHMGWEPYVPMT